MKRIALLVSLSLGIGLAATASFGTRVFPVEKTCPIGGEKFQAYEVASSTSWGSRPDGRGYGTLSVWPLVECPGNGFLLFKDSFTEQEIAILAPAVASDTYQAMRLAETPHYRAWWLMSQIETDPYDRAGTLLQASWESDEDLVRKARYQEAYVTAATALQLDANRLRNWHSFQLRAINAMRELGRFDEAALRLPELDRPEYFPDDVEDHRGLRGFIDALGVLIAEGNRAAEPVTLVPPSEAIERCRDHRDELTPSEVRECRGPGVVGAIRELKRQQRQANARANDAAAMASEAAAAASAAADASRDATKKY